MRKIKQIERKNKIALYVHLEKRALYIYLPKEIEILEDKKGYIITLKVK